MRVLQINTFSYKATGNIMMNIHELLKKQGAESYVCWGRGRQSEDDHELCMHDFLGESIHGAYTRLTGRTGFASVRATRRLLDWIDNIKPDIIHLHNIHGYYINIELLFKYFKTHKIKVVWTMHDCWPITGHCAYFDAIGCDKWKTGCSDCPQKESYPKSFFMDSSKWNWEKKKELFCGVDLKIITVSNWLKDIMKESFLKEYEIQTIYNGIDLSCFTRMESRFKKNNKLMDKYMVLGVASEWTLRKGLKDFIELSKILEEKYVIVLVGLTKKQIKKVSKYKNIYALERTKSVKDLVEIYSSADVFFNASVEETMGMTTLEALACGTPSIVYDATALPEILMELGLFENVVEIHDVEQVKRLIELYTDGKCLPSNIKEGLYYFEKSHQYEKYIEMYRHIEMEDKGKNEGCSDSSI